MCIVQGTLRQQERLSHNVLFRNNRQRENYTGKNPAKQTSKSLSHSLLTVIHSHTNSSERNERKRHRKVAFKKPPQPLYWFFINVTDLATGQVEKVLGTSRWNAPAVQQNPPNTVIFKHSSDYKLLCDSRCKGGPASKGLYLSQMTSISVMHLTFQTRQSEQSILCTIHLYPHDGYNQVYSL